jgi:hypothetical protein
VVVLVAVLKKSEGTWGGLFAVNNE